MAIHPLHKLIERKLARYRAVAMQAHYEPLLPHLSWLEQVDERELALSERTDEQESDVLQLMAALRPHCIVEFGCGSGSLTSKLAQLPWQPAVTGCDPSYSAIQIARQRAGKDGGATMVFLQSALPYYDPRLRNQEPTMKQVFILCDVLEHLNPGSIAAATELIFAVYRPDYVIVTMPNHEYSRNWPNMARRMVGGRRFEWTRAEFERWVESVVQERRYRYRTGEMDEATPAPDGPWQMVLFVAGDAKYGNSAHDAT